MDFGQLLNIYMPSIVLIFGAIAILIVNSFTKEFSRSLNIALCLLFIAISFGAIVNHSHFEMVGKIAFLSENIILISGFVFVFLIFSGKRFIEFQTSEFYSLYLFSIAGFCIMLYSDSLILILLGIEIGSMPLAIMMALSARLNGIEAGIKYFIMSTLASIFFVLGIALFYLYSGEINVSSISNFILNINQETRYKDLMLYFAILFIFASIGFKVSLIPWHTWMPDVYEGSNPVLAGFISIVPKIAAFAVFAHIFIPINQALIGSNSSIATLFDFMLKSIIILTIIVPNILALIQKDVKRMLAFSSISHSGFALACIYYGVFDTLFLYWLMFSITNIGAFAVLWSGHNEPMTWHNRFEFPYEKFIGLVRIHPIMSIILAIFMISLAGVPPFAVFWGKIMVVMLAIKNRDIFLPFVMMLSSAIAVYYYLRLIVYMFFKKPENVNPNLYIENETYSTKIIIGISCVLCIFSIFIVAYFV